MSFNGKEKGLLDIGAKCSVDTCSVIDYLPLKCPRCNKGYCTSHQQNVIDCCSNQLIVNNVDFNKRTIIKCCIDGCDNEVFNQTNYCLEHRHSEIPFERKVKNSISDDQQRKLEAIKSRFGNSKQSTTNKRLNDNRISKIKIKMKAKCLRPSDANINVNDRIHIAVKVNDNNNDEYLYYYFSRSISVGRLIDLICEKIDISSSQYVLCQNTPDNQLNNLGAVCSSISHLDGSLLLLQTKEHF